MAEIQHDPRCLSLSAKRGFQGDFGALMFTELAGEPVYSGAGCDSAARPVLRGFGQSNLAVLVTQYPNCRVFIEPAGK